MTGVVSFENIHDMHSVAENFSYSLSRSDNADIAKDFPGTVRRYSGDVEDVYMELTKTREQCQGGARE